ncbi:MAG: hypothetical protein HKP61_13675, partial [Dactylosporangium sp.]|nr:hypothetical protein [Dactylosporangium sp.]
TPHRAMPPLTVRFVCELAGAETTRAWVRAVAVDSGVEAGVRENAHRLLDHLGRSGMG